VAGDLYPEVVGMTQHSTRNVPVMLGFAATVVFGALAGLFIAGEALSDPGGSSGALMVAAWAVPLAALIVLALVRPETGQQVLVGVTALAVLVTLVQATVTMFPREWGPLSAVVTYVAGIAAGCLGLHRPRAAAGMLATLVGGTVLGVLLSFTLHATGVLPPGPGVGASAMVLALPFLLIALAYLFGAPVPVEGSARDLTPSSTRPR
jgi:hypothetical protein